MANTITPTVTGLGWDEDYPRLIDPIGQDCLEIQDLRKGVRIRLEKEHVLPAASGAGGEHLKGSAKIYAGDYSAAWPTLRPDGSTTLTADDTGRLAIDTTTSPNRIAIYIHGTGWVVIGTLLGDTIVTTNITSTNLTSEYLKLLKRSADPTDEADYGFVYTKDVTVGETTTTELFYIDSAGTVKQISNAGKLNIAAADLAADLIDDTKIRLRNAQYLRARNEADSGDVNLIKAGRNEADDADVAVLPDAVRTATNAAPIDPTSIVNKKYVDGKLVASGAEAWAWSSGITNGVNGQDLDLSSLLGTNKHVFALLAFLDMDEGAAFWAAKKKGDTDFICNYCHHDYRSQIWVETDADGKVTWKTYSNRGTAGTKIYLVKYIELPN